MRKIAGIVALIALAACDSTPTQVGDPFTISGTIQNNTGASIPANARVLVVWAVSTGSPDYAYIFGEGTVTAEGTFQLTFPGDPPAAAMNSFGLGVGLLFLTTDQNLKQGIFPQNTSPAGILGISEDYSVIFRKNLDPSVAAWPSAFPERYAVGLVQRSTTGFDSFTVTSSNSVVIVVDDLSNLSPPNWT